MDVFSHALWTNILYLKARRYALWGVLFGVLPDLISFGPFFFKRILSPEGDAPPFGHRPEAFEIPSYVFSLYNWTHSLVVFAVAVLVILLIMRKIWWPMFGWGFHVLIDIFTHTDRFFPTPFLWPISNFKISVISWGNPVFLAVNAGVLVAAYISLFILRRRRIQ